MASDLDCCLRLSYSCSCASSSLLRWADGFVVGDTPLGRATPPGRAKEKSTSAAGSRRRTVERYSSSYHNLSYLSAAWLLVYPVLLAVTVWRLLLNRLLLKDSHLTEWLQHLDPEVCTTVMLQGCSREELFCLLFLATGLSPTSRIPSLPGFASVCDAQCST